VYFSASCASTEFDAKTTVRQAATIVGFNTVFIIDLQVVKYTMNLQGVTTATEKFTRLCNRFCSPIHDIKSNELICKDQIDGITAAYLARS
jgi:nitrogen fixation protein FixH